MTHDQYLALKRFDTLDGLRAISILAVIWHHTAPSWVSGWAAHIGADGVTLFFAISGFLITTLLLRERSRKGNIDIKAFYVRRTLRIFPLYYAVLALYVVLVSLLERNSAAGQAFFSNLIYFATYTTNLFVDLDGRVIFYFAWSLAAEEQFYLLWPAVVIATRTLPRAAGVLLLVLLASVAGQLLSNPFLSGIPVAIVTGSLLAVTLHSKSGFERLQPLLGQRWSAMVLATAALGCLTVINAPPFVVHLLLAALVISSVVQEAVIGKSLLTLRPMVYLGSISYGMYMLHMLAKNFAVKVLNAVSLPSDGLLVFAATIVLATIAAGLSFRYFESYFLRLKHQHER
jgi:peptidoglycan/LPS O-acetylase OafA/YrhL